MVPNALSFRRSIRIAKSDELRAIEQAFGEYHPGQAEHLTRVIGDHMGLVLGPLDSLPKRGARAFWGSFIISSWQAAEHIPMR